MRLESRFYLNWLSISVPEGVTPDHYTLLGIRHGETDIAIIDQASDVRFCMMRKADIGEYPDEFREMLRQLEQARTELIFPLRSGVKPPAAPPMDDGRIVVGKEIVEPEKKPQPQTAVEHDGSLVGWKSKAIFFTQCALAFGLGMCACLSMMAAAPRHPDNSVNFEKEDANKIVEAPPYTTLPDTDGKRPDLVHIDDKIRELAAEIPDEPNEPMDGSPQIPDEPGNVSPQQDDPAQALPEAPVVEPAPVEKVQDITPITDETPETEQLAPVPTTPELRSPANRRVSPLRKIHTKNTIAQTPVAEPKTPEPEIAPEIVPEIAPEVELTPGPQLAAETPGKLPDSLDLESFILPEAPADLTELALEPETEAVVAVVEPAVVRLPVPSPEELEPEKVKLQGELAEKIKSPADRRGLIALLFEGATAEKLSPVKRYLALDAALSLAVLERDSQEAMKILAVMEQYFEIDGPVARYEVIQGLSQQLAREKANESTANLRDFLTAGGNACNALVSARHFEMAARLSDLVSNVVSNAGTEAEKSDAIDLKVRFNSVWNRWNEYNVALETVKKSPEDRDANLIVGLWLCGMERNLPEALPYFAQGMDDTLREIARQELGAAGAGKLDSTVAMKLGDGWWQLADTKAYTMTMRKVMRDHAISIYKKLEPTLDDLQAKDRISSRISQPETVER